MCYWKTGNNLIGSATTRDINVGMVGTILGEMIATTSTRTQESNKQNREFIEENYGWVSRKPEKYQKHKDLAPKGHLKARGIFFFLEQYNTKGKYIHTHKKN